MEIYVARQPIFDKKVGLNGYELLFRGGLSNAFPDVDGDKATSKVLSDSFFLFGIDQIAGGKKAFINFTQSLLEKKVPSMFPREKIIVEILEDVEPKEEVIRACQELVRDGYEIALDDFFYRSDLKPLIELAKIIKIDLRVTPIEKAKEILEKLSGPGVRFLAEKVETHEEFQQAMEVGFEYFQGYFFSKPQVFRAKDIAPSKIDLLQIMATGYETGDWQGFSEMSAKIGIREEKIPEFYRDAIGWADSLMAF